MASHKSSPGFKVGVVSFKPWAENSGGIFSNGNLGYCEEKKNSTLERQSQIYFVLNAEPFLRLTNSKRKVLKGIIS